EPSSASPRLVQARRKNRRTLSRLACHQPIDRGSKCHRKPLPAPLAAAVRESLLRAMNTRLLDRTGLRLPILGFGASSLGQECRRVSLEEALASVRVALECGLNFIDTSPFYGRGSSEVLLGIALRDVPRESYILCTKLGRYDLGHFDF